MHLPLLYVHVSFPLTKLETPFYNFRLLGLFGTDERVLGRRTYGYVPRGRNHCHAGRFKRNFCGSSIFFLGALISILEFLGPAGRVHYRSEIPQATDHTRDVAKV
jgi:hypothetical protein